MRRFVDWFEFEQLLCHLNRRWPFVSTYAAVNSMLRTLLVQTIPLMSLLFVLSLTSLLLLIFAHFSLIFAHFRSCGSYYILNPLRTHPNHDKYVHQHFTLVHPMLWVQISLRVTITWVDKHASHWFILMFSPLFSPLFLGSQVTAECEWKCV